MVLTSNLLYMASMLFMEATKGEYIICPAVEEDVVETLGLPSQPLNLDIIVFYNESALLKWEEPEDDGGFDITGYQIEYRTVNDDFAWRTGVQVSGEPKQFNNEEPVFVAIQNGLMLHKDAYPYEFRVLAMNENGYGEPSKSVAVDPPLPPLDLYVKDINKAERYVLLEWTKPLHDGGKDILFYVLEYKASSQDFWNFGTVTLGNYTTTKIENFNFIDLPLTSPLLRYYYAFRAQAWNIAGLSDYSNIAYIKNPPVAKNVKVVSLDENSAELEWELIDPDIANFTSKVAILYAIRYREVGTQDWSTKMVEDVTKDGSVISAKLEIPIRGKRIEFSITTVTAAGKSKPSTPVFIETASPPFDLTILNKTKERVVLKWEKPHHDGGAEISDYIVEYRNKAIRGHWKEYEEMEGSSLNMMARLKNKGENYEYRVRAVNSAGRSEPSNVAFIEEPSAPRNLTIREIRFEEGTALIQWMPPESDGNATITEYIVQCRDVLGDTWKMPKRGGNFSLTDLSAFLTGLDTINNSYVFRVAAVNIAGRGNYSDVAYFVKPNPPENFSIEWINEEHKYAILKWRIPTSDGGTPITGYAIEYREIPIHPKSVWKRVDVYTINLTNNYVSTHFRKVVRGKTFEYRVVARNMAGYSLPSLSDLIKPPNAPKNLIIKNINLKNGTVTLEWSKPDYDGGRSVLGYIIEYKKKWSTTDWVTEEINSTAENITRVINGVGFERGDVYKYRVRAFNAAGRGSYSKVVSVERPGPPLNLEIIDINADDGFVVLKWMPPLKNGGEAIKEYVIQYREKDNDEWTFGANVSGNSLTAKLTGLNTSDITYEFHVIARNVAGLGPHSNTTFVEKPLPPHNLRVVDLDLEHGTADLAWQRPITVNGSKIKGYRIYHRIKDKVDAWTKGEVIYGDFLEGTQPGLLLKDYVYEFVVKSLSLTGFSEPSEIASVDKPSTPERLTITQIVYDNRDTGRVYLSWKKSEIPGVGDKKGYLIEYRDINENEWDRKTVKVEGENVLEVKVSGLNLNSVTYVFRIKAYNMAGFSKPSVEIHIDKPRPPKELEIITMYEDSVVLQWKKPSNRGRKPVIDYLIEYKNRNSHLWIAGVTATGLNGTQTGLDLKNWTYEFRVRSRNMAGYSLPSNIAYVEKPQSPENVEIRKMTDTESFNGSATVAWHRPINPNRKAPILGYIIEYKDVNNKKGAWSTHEVDKNIISDTVYGLNLRYVTYVFRVKAYNMAGAGNASKETVAHKPPAPKYIKIVNMSEPDNCVELRWSSPENEELYDIIYYLVEYTILNKDDEDWRDAGKYQKETQTKICSRALNMSMFEYKFRVKAVNIAGSSAPSKEDFVEKPDAPLHFNVTKINVKFGFADLEWEKPPSDGGRPITHYLIEYRTKQEGLNWLNVTHKSSGSKIYKARVTKLNFKNYTYDFKVRACNMAGKSENSNIVSIDRPKTPDYFQVTQIFTSNGTATFDWNTPDDGGMDITGYRIEYRIKGKEGWSSKLLGTGTKGSINGLNLEENEYEFRIRAINMAGQSEPSIIDSIERPQAPGDLQILETVDDPDASSIEIGWSKPIVIDERTEITKNLVESLNKTSGTWELYTTVLGSKTRALVDKLSVAGGPFIVRVRSVNMAGIGQPSNTLLINS